MPLTTLPDSESAGVRRNLQLTAELLRLMEIFAAASVPLLPLKGPVLAETLYDDPSERPFADLDFLVKKHDVPRAVALLEGEGFALKSGWSWAGLPVIVEREFELSLVGTGGAHPGGTLVDLHWDTAPGDYPFRFDPEILWSHVRTVRIAGREVPSLDPECLLLFLCVHGTKHAWSRRIWVRDVERLIGAGDRIEPRTLSIDWPKAMELAKRAGCERPVLLGVLLAHDLFAQEGPEVPVPRGVLERARSIPVVVRLVAEIRERLDAPAVRELSGFEMVRFNARLSASAWGAFRHYGALLKAPTEADARLLRLPRGLFCLYYPFRLFRLIGKYGYRLIRAGRDAPGTGRAD